MAKPSAGASAPSQLAAYSDLFARLLDCVFLIDPVTQTILEVNPTCERVLGLPVEKLLGRPIAFWTDESMKEEFKKALRIAGRRYYPRQCEVLWQLNDGRMITFEIIACPLKLPDSTQVLQVIARDVTFKRATEQKVKQLLLELQAANLRLETLSTVDAMTNLYNYRYFKSKIEEEHIRSARYKKTYSVVFCDIDYFKKFNDKNGHPAGDQLLRDFADILKKSCREQDFPARYGGEEFVVICPETPCEGALVLAERIRGMVEATPFPQADSQPAGRVTVSIGVATFPTDGDSPEHILESADQALYHSKSHGRNQVTAASKIVVGLPKAS